MKFDISYVLKGQFYSKIVQFRSLSRQLELIETQGASAITVTKAS